MFPGDSPPSEEDVGGGVIAREGIGRLSIFRFEDLRLTASDWAAGRGGGGRDVRAFNCACTLSSFCRSVTAVETPTAFRWIVRAGFGEEPICWEKVGSRSEGFAGIGGGFFKPDDGWFGYSFM